MLRSRAQRGVSKHGRRHVVAHLSAGLPRAIETGASRPPQGEVVIQCAPSSAIAWAIRRSCKIEERPIPETGPADVLIKVGAASVNFPDVLMLSAGYQHKPELPFVPGMEGAGTIEAVGAEVKNWQPGDRVIFGVRPGAFAEYVRVPASGNLMRLPSGWSDAEGAAFRVGAHDRLPFAGPSRAAQAARSVAGARRLGRRRPGRRAARQASRRAGDRHRQRRCPPRRRQRERRRSGGQLPHRRFRGGGERR